MLPAAAAREAASEAGGQVAEGTGPWCCGGRVVGGSLSPARVRLVVEAAEAGTVRGRNGVVKGIAVGGRMVAENRVADLTEGRSVGTLAGIGLLCYSRWGP